MKSSIIRGVAIFAAGAGCAVMAGGYWMPPETNAEEFEVRLQKPFTTEALIRKVREVLDAPQHAVAAGN